MKNITFYDEHTARSYLINSIIRYKNTPIMITEVQETLDNNKQFRVTFNRLGDHNNRLLFLPDRQIDMNPVPLGMLNGNKTSCFVSRIPVRNWKIGLSAQNCHFKPILRQRLDEGGEEEDTFFLASVAMKNTIEGKYPSYATCYRSIIAGNRQTYAFSRRFAIDRQGLSYKSIDEPIGICEKTKPQLFDQYQYLEQVLEKDLS